MSDVPHDRDWWLASDDKWYPPEQHPDYGQRISAGEVGLESAAYEDPAVVDELPDDPMPEPEPVVIEAQPEPDPDPDPEPEPEPVVEDAEDPAAELAEQDASEVEENRDEGERGADGASFVDQLFELSEQRVAGEIDDDEFADAQTRLIQGD